MCRYVCDDTTMYRLHRISFKNTNIFILIHLIDDFIHLRFLFRALSQVDPELPETSAQDRRPRVLRAPGSRARVELAASSHPSLLHHMTYVGADGMDGPPTIIYQGHLQPVGLPDPARCQIGERLIDVSRSKRCAPPLCKTLVLWTNRIQ